MSRLTGALSPRVRVTFLLALILSAALLTSRELLLAMVAVGLLLVLAAGLSLRRLLKRLLWLAYLAAGLVVTLPLAVPGVPAFQLRIGSLAFPVSQEGLALAGLLCLRMLGCFLPALALTASTPFPELLEALGGLGVPRLFVALAGMAVRYIAVLQDEARRMSISRRSRGYRPAGAIWHRRTLQTTAQMLGMLLLRAYDRSERIYWAMISRGYNPQKGAASARPLSGGERWAVAAAVAMAAGLVLLDRKMMGGG